MDTMIFWLVIGTAVAVAGFSVILLQKKGAEAQRHLASLNTIKNKLAEKQGTLDDIEKQYKAELKKERARFQRLQDDLTSLKENHQSLSAELEDLKKQAAGKAEEAAQQIKILSDQLAAASADQDQMQNIGRQLKQTEQERDQMAAACAGLEKKLHETASEKNGAENLAEELAAVKTALKEKTKALRALEKDFENQMDEIVESSLQKISHAEEAKEEAIQAAQDNYEAAAEAHALLKEKDALIKKLQGQ